MKKLLGLYDKYILKILVGGLIPFVALYPKLPSINIHHTWVYIRLEDFFILITVFIWFVQLLRKKVSLFKPMSVSVGLYWLVGLLSLVFSFLFIAPNLTNFFPSIAVLSYIRRIEYLILFFVAFSAIKEKSDLRDFFVILASTASAVFLYALGQRYYLILWSALPSLQEIRACFPSFQTGNEEFAKGIPLCLPPGGRITSTFGGSYDLAAYSVLVIPIILGGFLAIKKRIWKILTGLIFLSGIIMLVFTAQRAAFVAFVIGSIFTLVLYKKKILIIPLLIISVLFLSIFSESTARRFLSTFRVAEVVVDDQGKLIGGTVPSGLKSDIEGPNSGEELPEGSAFIGLSQDKDLEKTDSAIVKRTLTPEEARRRRLQSGSVQISTVSGSFLVKKVLLYDISFTTRFQAEWPNAWKAYERNKLLGSGYSTITLATDNDYFRAIGETGVLGLFSFIGIFVMLYVVLLKLAPISKPSLASGFAYGLAGGVLGLLVNAILIDVFEASKVAESLWILSGIGVGSLLLYQKNKISWITELGRVLTTNIAYFFYLLMIIVFVFLPSMGNFFVADDFTWLRWAANDDGSMLLKHFVDAQGFFYRPLDKIITYFLYVIFSFQPHAYHVFITFLHYLGIIGVFLFAKQVSKKGWIAFLVSIIFAIHPTHAENVFWYSGLSGVLAVVFIIYGLISFYRFREKRSILSYCLAFVFSLLAFASYEIAVAIPFVFLAIDICLFRATKKLKYYLPHVLFFALIPAYYILRIFADAFQSGGDYTYNFLKLIPNIIGNFLGYIALFLGGDLVLPVYNSLRDGLRDNSFTVGFLIIIFLGVASFVIYKSRKVINDFFGKDGKEIVFGIVFAFSALIPFLGLGNIADRYMYLASIGFSISLIYFVNLVSAKINKKHKALIAFVFVFVLLLFYYQSLVKAENKWKESGFVTKNTLYFFRANYQNLNNKDYVYLVNTPVKYKGVWAFPTGVEDGLWFIYGDNLPNITYVDSIGLAKKEALKNPTSSYIFSFDKYGDIARVK